MLAFAGNKHLAVFSGALGWGHCPRVWWEHSLVLLGFVRYCSVTAIILTMGCSSADKDVLRDIADEA